MNIWKRTSDTEWMCALWTISLEFGAWYVYMAMGDQPYLDEAFASAEEAMKYCDGIRKQGKLSHE